MKPPYRVQEYSFDMGVYHKQQILDDVSHKAYSEKNVYQKGFYVILPSDDIFAKTLPDTVRSESERIDLIRSHEKDREVKNG